jgi:hypothetical protein
VTVRVHPAPQFVRHPPSCRKAGTAQSKNEFERLQEMVEEVCLNEIFLAVLDR